MALAQVTSFLGDKGPTGRKSFGGPSGLQVASPLGDHMSLALWGTKGLTCRKLFGVPRRLDKSQALFVNKGLQVASPLGDQGLTSRRPFG